MLSPYMLIIAQEGTYVLLIGCAVHQNRIIPLATSYTNDVYIYFLGNLLVFCYTQCYYVWSRQRQRYYSVLVNSASEKASLYFSMWKFSIWKREANHKEKKRNRKIGCSISSRLSTDTRSFPNRIFSKGEMKFPWRTTFDIWNHQPLTLLFTAPPSRFSIIQLSSKKQQQIKSSCELRT